jgi:hypothetical protein
MARHPKFAMTAPISESPESEEGTIVVEFVAGGSVFDFFDSVPPELGPRFLFLSRFLRLSSKSLFKCGCLRKHLASV